MFNIEEDEKNLKEAVKFVMDEYKRKRLESLGRVLYVFKISGSYLLAFIGFVFIMVTMINTNLPDHKDIIKIEQSNVFVNISNQVSLQTCLDNYNEIVAEHNQCQTTLENYSDTCEKYCIQKVFKPVCERYNQ